MYEPISVEIDRAHGEGNYRSYSINFIGVPCSTWSTLTRLKLGGLPDVPSTRSSTPAPVVPLPGRDIPDSFSTHSNE